MINQVNENTASSIQILNDNLVQAVNTINGGISEEVESRKEGDQELQESIDTLSERVEVLENKEENSDTERLIEEEKAAREAKDEELEEKINSSVSSLNNTITIVNENASSSIQTLNDNLVQAINTINGGIDNEIRPELEKSVKYSEDLTGCGTRAIQLEVGDVISAVDSEGDEHNMISLDSSGKVHIGSTTSPLNLNTSERITVNSSEEIAYLSDVVTDLDFESLKSTVEENSEKINELNTTLVDAVGSLNSSLSTKVEELNTKIDVDVLQRINDLEEDKVGYTEIDKDGVSTQNIVLENYASVYGKDTQGGLHNLATVSKTDIVDLGTNILGLNFSGSGERPTYNLNSELALLSDIPSTSNFITKDDISSKQDTLTAGSGIVIEDNVISIDTTSLGITTPRYTIIDEMSEDLEIPYESPTNPGTERIWELHTGDSVFNVVSGSGIMWKDGNALSTVEANSVYLIRVINNLASYTHYFTI